jgi:acyl CoA:acetate/3-ketoacid CoA transferase beta subunit
MALRWTAAGMMEARKGFRRLMAYKQLPTLKAALLAHQAVRSAPATNDGALAVIEPTAEGLLLKELAPGITVTAVRQATEAELIIPEHVPEMPIL